jgi:hypothetical protein
MGKIVGGLFALIFCIVLAGSAHAGTYSTPMLEAGSTGSTDSLTCMVSNIGTTPVDLTVTFYNPGGGVVAPSSATCGAGLAAGSTCFVKKSGVVALRCTVEASSSKVRAVLFLTGSSGIQAAVAATKK